MCWLSRPCKRTAGPSATCTHRTVNAPVSQRCPSSTGLAAIAAMAGIAGWRKRLRAGGGRTIATSAGKTFCMRGVSNRPDEPRAASAWLKPAQIHE